MATSTLVTDVMTKDVITLSPEQSLAEGADVRAYEPAGALFAGVDGLDDYRVLIPQLPELLCTGGAALVEIGYRQAPAVIAIADAAGLAAQLHHDLAGRPRVLQLCRKG